MKILCCLLLLASTATAGDIYRGKIGGDNFNARQYNGVGGVTRPSAYYAGTGGYRFPTHYVGRVYAPPPRRDPAPRYYPKEVDRTYTSDYIVLQPRPLSSFPFYKPNTK